MVWLLVLLPFFYLVARLWPYDPYSGDYAQYLLHARALLEGRPYTATGYIYSPYSAPGPEAYPPGFPMALYVLFSLFGWHTNLGRLLVLASAVTFFVLSGRYFTNRHGARLAIAVPLVIGFAPQIAENAVQIVSDMSFCALCWGTFTLADRPRPWSWRTAAALTILGALAILTRSAGVALVPAMVLYGLSNSRQRALWLPLAVACVWGLTFWYTARSFPTVGSYAGFVGGGDASGPADGQSVRHVQEVVAALTTRATAVLAGIPDRARLYAYVMRFSSIALAM